MGHQLVIDIPEEIYLSLEEKARREGTTPEELAKQWIAAAAAAGGEDPLERLFGSIQGRISDWAQDHDRYLGEAIANKA